MVGNLIGTGLSALGIGKGAGSIFGAVGNTIGSIDRGLDNAAVNAAQTAFQNIAVTDLNEALKTAEQAQKETSAQRERDAQMAVGRLQQNAAANTLDHAMNIAGKMQKMAIQP